MCKKQQIIVADIAQKELNEILSNGEVIDFVEILIGCITHNKNEKEIMWWDNKQLKWL